MSALMTGRRMAQPTDQAWNAFLAQIGNRSSVAVAFDNAGDCPSHIRGLAVVYINQKTLRVAVQAATDDQGAFATFGTEGSKIELIAWLHRHGIRVSAIGKRLRFPVCHEPLKTYIEGTHAN